MERKRGGIEAENSKNFSMENFFLRNHSLFIKERRFAEHAGVGATAAGSVYIFYSGMETGIIILLFDFFPTMNYFI